MSEEKKPDTPTTAPEVVADQHEATVEISKMEYDVLKQMATDFGDVISHMGTMADLFKPNPGEPPINTPGDMIKLMISKPGRVNKLAEAMAPLIVNLSPFVQKYQGRLPTSKDNVDTST